MLCKLDFVRYVTKLDVKSHLLTININLFKQLNINQMFDKIQMILMMKTSISSKGISRLNQDKISNVNTRKNKHYFCCFLNNMCNSQENPDKFHGLTKL